MSESEIFQAVKGKCLTLNYNVMRQIKNCKVGHFVKYNGILCQINCFYTNAYGKCATLVEVKEGARRMFTPFATERVDYIGERATDEEGNFWISKLTKF